jgi:hypothetical protein
MGRSATTTESEFNFERDVEAEYRLNRFFYVTTGYTQRRPVPGSTSSATASQDFNVNLKARWEY